MVSVAPVVAWSAGEDPVKAPYIEAGDCWSYRATRLFHHGWINEYRECVTHVDKAKNLVLALITVKDDGREIETAYSLNWGERTPVDGTYYEPQAEFLRFPLQVGDAYPVSFHLIDTQNVSTRRLLASWEMKVVGWEEISVPAGKFRALRIEGRGFRQSAGNREAALARTIWYVPEINRAIKVSYSSLASSMPNGTDSFAVELTSYELNK